MPRKNPPSPKSVRRVFTQEFKQEAVQMLLDGHTGSSVAERHYGASDTKGSFAALRSIGAICDVEQVVLTGPLRHPTRTMKRTVAVTSLSAIWGPPIAGTPIANARKLDPQLTSRPGSGQ